MYRLDLLLLYSPGIYKNKNMIDYRIRVIIHINIDYQLDNPTSLRKKFKNKRRYNIVVSWF